MLKNNSITCSALFFTAAALFFAIVFSLVLVVLDYEPLPFLEQWRVIEFHRLYNDGSLSFNDLSITNNEHIIVFQSIINLIDAQYFNAKNLFSLCLIWLMQIFSALMIFFSAYSKTENIGRLNYLVLSLLIFTFAFSPQQIVNLTWGFQVSFISVFFFGLLSIWCMRYLSSRSALGISVGLLSVIASASAATMSLASGVTIWLALLLYCWIGKINWKPALVISIFSILALSYFLFVQISDGSKPVGALSSSKGIVEFTLWYLALLGSPFSIFTEYGQLCLGLLGVVILALFLWPAFFHLRQKLNFSHGNYFLLTSAFYLSLSLFAISLGRFETGLSYTSTSRYATPSLILWAILCCLILVRVGRSKKYSWGVVYFLSALSLIAFASLATGWGIHKNLNWSIQQRQEALVAYRAGVYVEPLMQAYHYDHPTLVVEWLDYLRDREMSVFSDVSKAINPPNISIENLSTMEKCLGNIERVNPVFEDNLVISGWALSQDKVHSVRRVFTYDEAFSPLGYGLSTVRRPELKENLGLLWEVKGFNSYARVGDASKIYVVGQFANASICYIGELSEIPRSKVFGFSAYERASGLKEVNVELEREAVEGGIKPNSIRFPLESKNIYGTWNDSDYDTGVILFRFALETAIKSIIVPIYTGVNANNLSIQLIESSSGEVLDIWKARSLSRWQSVLLYPPNDFRGLVTLKITDNDSAWGSWIASGNPRINPE